MNSDIKDSMIILIRLKNQLGNAYPGLKYLVGIKEEVLKKNPSNVEVYDVNTSMYCLIHYLFISFVSFSDEYNKYFLPAIGIDETKRHLIETSCERYFKVIDDIFGNIKMPRNQVLAHGYRDNKGNPLSNEEINKLYNQLISFPDMGSYEQLANIPDKVVQEIEKVFGKMDENEVSL
ncbi:MAG: hypothetical protein P4L51_24390 [Puia sp.]|nr:hypothetical protein [Puia sp.]